MKRPITLIILLLLLHYDASAQLKKWLKVKNDTAYIRDLTNDLTLRAFAETKVTKYTPGEYGYPTRLSYRANDNYNLGVGFNYKYIGLNLGFKMPFANGDGATYGKTEFSDAQFVVYHRKFTLDLFYRAYQGYYVTNKAMLTQAPSGEVFPQRPDLRTKNGGLSFQYIFNNTKFSFRGPFQQIEVQKKSAGSVLVGATVYHINVHADAPIIPPNIAYPGYFEQSTFTGSGITSLGLNAGYGYTQVIKKDFFVTGCMLVGAGINHSNMTDDLHNTSVGRTGAEFNGTVQLAAGYNTRHYFVGLQYINHITRNNSPVSRAWQEFQAGNAQLTFAKRIALKRKTRRKLNKIENSIKKEIGLKPDATGK